MANAAKGEHAVEIDGRVWVLVYDANAFCEIEDALGVPIAQLDARLADGRVKDLRAVLWAGLLARQPDITLREAGALLAPKAMGEAIMAAIRKAMPEEEPSGNGAAAAGGTG